MKLEADSSKRDVSVGNDIRSNGKYLIIIIIWVISSFF